MSLIFIVNFQGDLGITPLPIFASHMLDLYALISSRCLNDVPKDFKVHNSNCVFQQHEKL